MTATIVLVGLFLAAFAWFHHYSRPYGPAFERARRRRVWGRICFEKSAEDADAYMVKNYGPDWRDGKERAP